MADLRPASTSFGEFELLRQLTEAAGIPGREERIRQLVLEETAGLWDETFTDNMGNLICLKKATRADGRRTPDSKRPARRTAEAAAAKATTADQISRFAGANPDRTPRVMIACHMDEIGFYVRFIDDQGRLRLQNAGGFDTRNLFARRVLVQGRKDLIGILNPGGKPIHISSEEDRKKIPDIGDFFVDLFLPKEQVKKLVEIGDPVTLIQHTEMIGDAITGKAMDNRVALWTGISAVRKVFGDAGGKTTNGSGKRKAAAPAKAPGSRYDVYFVACVQEEVGLRGAQTAAFTVEPDVGIAIDTTLACDTPGIEKNDSVTCFGEGVGIKVMDGASISHRGLFEEFLKLARDRKIKHQLEVLPRGGTDAGALQRSRGGTRAITLSVPTRYIHTVTESINKNDARAAVDLLAAWLSA